MKKEDSVDEIIQKKLESLQKSFNEIQQKETNKINISNF